MEKDSVGRMAERRVTIADFQPFGLRSVDAVQTCKCQEGGVNLGGPASQGDLPIRPSESYVWATSVEIQADFREVGGCGRTLGGGCVMRRGLR